MAKYKVLIRTERDKLISRLGRREIRTHTCGWDNGVRVVCDAEGIKAYSTGGSNNPVNKTLIYETDERTSI